jgi:5,10-methylene-tetrahydrofolate dehydrogenase/methenyl tetrahydrofolate cyclohydrolase
MLGNPVLLPCSLPASCACSTITGISVSGKECVVVGRRSNIVWQADGELLLAGRTARSRPATPAPRDPADGHPQSGHFGRRNRRTEKKYTGDKIKEGAVVVDVGMKPQ